jgi:hypothetical protein
MCTCKEERHNQNVVRRAQDEMRVVILSTVVIAAAAATTTAIRELIETVHKMNYITKEIVCPT